MGPISPLKKPAWLKVRAPGKDQYFQIKEMLNDLKLATVCQSANCPNLAQCWEGGTATFMLLGDTCTRACRFCAVKTGNPQGLLDPAEAQNTAQAVYSMKLDYVVLTSVDRDDLPDHGSNALADTINCIRAKNPKALIEILSPDFSGHDKLLSNVINARPDVFAHNIETVARLSPAIRDRRANYQTSLRVLKQAKQMNPGIYTKSSIMLGLGETDNEIIKTLHDLRDNNVDIVTFGQYLSPNKMLARHLPIKEYIHPDKFKFWHDKAMEMGFLYVASGPLVRSSYRAGEYFMTGIIRQAKEQKPFTTERLPQIAKTERQANIKNRPHDTV